MPSRIYGLRNALRAFIKALWNTSFQNSASIRRAEATTLRRGEQLEPRWQCSATAQLIGSDFFVRGDNYGNTMNLALEQRNGRDYLVARDAFNTIISGTQAEASLVKRIQVLGGSGKDTIHLGTLDLKKLPNLREVHLYGSGGNDAITGSRGSDFIYAGDGDDVVNSGNGMTYQGFQPHDVIYGDAGNDDIFGNDGYYGKFTFYGGTGNDRMWGNYQDDLFYGDLGNDIMYPAGGNDILEGGLGDDQYYYSSGAMNKDMVLDIGGTDFLVISGFTKGMGVDLRKWGTDPSQSLTTDFDPATNDCIFLQVLQNSIENIVGTNYDDILIGNELANYIQAEGGNDQLLGLGGSDDLRGELGNDVYVYGPADNDPLAVDSILDAAGRGQDRFDFTAFTQGVHADLATNTIRTADRMRIIAQGKVENAKSVCEIEDLTGSRWQDFLLGNNLANVLRGGGGDDVFWGGTAGNDSLQGEIGDDLYYVTERGANLGQVRLIEQSGQGQDTLDFTYFAALGMPIRSMGNQVFSRQTSQLLATLEGNSGYFEQWHGAL